MKQVEKIWAELSAKEVAQESTELSEEVKVELASDDVLWYPRLSGAQVTSPMKGVASTMTWLGHMPWSPRATGRAAGARDGLFFRIVYLAEMDVAFEKLPCYFTPKGKERRTQHTHENGESPRHHSSDRAIR